MSTWRPCSSCKKPILTSQTYWVCNVSTCNRTRTPFQFCSVACWDAHVPVMNHRSAWCEERRAPSDKELAGSLPRPGRVDAPPPPPGVGASRSGRPLSHEEQRAERLEANRRRIARSEPAEPDPADTEVLVVASRLKDYIQRHGDMRVAADSLDVLSDIIRREALRAIERAREDGRKTVKGRDFR